MRRIFLIALVVILVGCATTSPSQMKYPAELTGIGDSPNYPLEAAGFTRGKIMMYAPGMKDISTGYNMFTPENQIASTIYVYQYPVEALALFEAEKNNITEAHNGAELLSETEVELVKNGNKYVAFQATYKFNANLNKKYQEVFSRFVLWKHKNSFIKLRSTSPIAQEKQTIVKNTALLNAINWAN